MNETIDPTIKSLAQSIKKQETGGHKDPYRASGASGEFGAYQFMPETYKAWAGKYLGDPNAPSTVENQNKIAYKRIKEWKDQGLNPAQIAAAWNAGEGSLQGDKWKTNVGTNQYGVKYDTPSYVKNVSKYYNEYKTQGRQPTQPITPEQPESSVVSTLDKYGKVIAGAVEKAPGFVYDVMSEPSRKLGFGLANAIRPMIGKEQLPSFTDPLTGEQTAPVGYDEQGNKVGPLGTAEQVAGNVANAALLAYTGPAQIGRDLAINAGTKILPKFFKASLGGAGLFGAQGVASSMADNEGPLDVAISGLKNAGLGFLTMGALGAGSAGLEKLSGVANKFDNAVMTAKESGNQDALTAVWNSPEGKSRLRSLGFESIQDAEQGMNKIIDMQKNAIVSGENLVKNPTKQAVINNFLNKEDGQVMKDFSQYVIPNASGNVPNMLQTTERIKSEMTHIADTKNSLLSEATKAGVNFDIPSTDLINKAVGNLETAGINEGLAKKYILDEVSKLTDKNGMVTTANQSKLQSIANKNFNELGSYEDSSREAASRALGNALRGHIDDTINKASGLDTSLASGIKNLNTAYGRLANVNRVVQIIPQSFRVPKEWVAGQVIGAIASHGYDPITYQVAKGVTNYMMGKKASVDVTASLTNKAAGVANNEIKESVANAKGLINFLKNKSATTESARTAEVARQALAKAEAERVFKKAGNIRYTPDEALPVIQAGATPKSKYSIDSGLPSVDVAPNVYSNKTPRVKYTPEPHIPDNQLPVINTGETPRSKYSKPIKDLPTIQLGKNPKGSATTDALIGAGILSSGAILGNEGYNALQDRFGKETYNSASTPQTINGGQNIDNQEVSRIKDNIGRAETSIVKEPYSFSQWSHKQLGPASPLGKALGKYQVTEARLREKAEAFLGKKVTPQQFLKSPELQDRFIENQIKWQLENGMTENQVYGTHRRGWGNLKPEQLKKAEATSSEYIKRATGK